MTKHEVLKKYFGYDTFRQGQEQLVDTIMKGGDCLGVMPTGAGKSLCFQVPAMLLTGITIVISPLISLMKDQVNTLTQLGIKAAFINSSLSERQIEIAINRAINGEYKIIYIAPERLETNSFLSFARQASISMVTVDEAHCISQWGQDFRPSYVKIPDFISNLSARPIVTAFTATATQDVQDDIIKMLCLENPLTLVSGFDRSNLSFSVMKPEKKFDQLMAFLTDRKANSGIVYCATRKAVDEVCTRLNSLGYSASRYHAGLSDIERHTNQDDFLYDNVKIMVATNAFGMGIDKSNVSFVVHYNMPKNIESYYQEAGRAGRDGEPAECLLLYSGQDVRTNLFLIENNKDAEYPNVETEQMLKERDRQRLRKMTFYCYTNDCLRGYILKYFGERPENFCGNCSNCLTNFYVADVTVESQKILSCVIKSGERYGVKTIIDTLRGSDNERIKRTNLNKLSTYNISNLSEKSLRDIINHLVLNEFLIITDDEYPILKRGARAKEALQKDASIEMKLIKEEVTAVARTANNNRSNHIDKVLFDNLKALRLRIAEEQRVPAFVIFHDSTLTDMCIKLPRTEREMLNVSGVGHAKFSRYGQEFLNTIVKFTTSQNEDETEEQKEMQEQASIEIADEAVTINVIADRINCVLLQKSVKKLTGSKLKEWLIMEDYLYKGSDGFKIPTDKGTALGITFEEREIRGTPCKVNYFDKAAQQFVINKFKDGLV